jgi:hypothetical protein
MTDNLDPGPHLVYRGTRDLDGTRTHWLIDMASPTDPRERAICRALLTHAIALLDASEPTSTTSSQP